MASLAMRAERPTQPAQLLRWAWQVWPCSSAPSWLHLPLATPGGTGKSLGVKAAPKDTPVCWMLADEGATEYAHGDASDAGDQGGPLTCARFQ